ncbi:MAG: hypothetical protein E4H28_02140 [Gemmatimonadales bacterium]|nr:MAG: hypothetical protein E4H28_02140 [Gemmatimonadales bacterium]
MTKVRDRRLAWKRALMDETGAKPSPHGELILQDLNRKCFGHKAAMIYSATSGQFDPIACAFAQGKQEVLRYILENLYLDERFIINAREVIPHDD